MQRYFRQWLLCCLILPALLQAEEVQKWSRQWSLPDAFILIFPPPPMDSYVGMEVYVDDQNPSSTLCLIDGQTVTTDFDGSRTVHPWCQVEWLKADGTTKGRVKLDATSDSLVPLSMNEEHILLRRLHEDGGSDLMAWGVGKGTELMEVFIKPPGPVKADLRQVDLKGAPPQEGFYYRSTIEGMGPSAAALERFEVVVSKPVLTPARVMRKDKTIRIVPETGKAASYRLQSSQDLTTWVDEKIKAAADLKDGFEQPADQGRAFFRVVEQ